MSEQMRSEFEAWAIIKGFRDSEKRLIKSQDELSCVLGTDGNFYYEHVRVMAAWNAWQASRAALCVELPKLSDQPVEDHYNWSACEQKCKDAIHAAGVKTK